MNERPVDYDLIVIGAGAIGVTIAMDAAERGLSTALVEARSGPGTGCSYANAGLLAPSHAHPLTGFGNVRAGLQNMLNPYGPFKLAPSPENLRWITRFLRASLPGVHGKAVDTQRRLSGASSAIHRRVAESGLDTGFRQNGLLDVYRDSAAAYATTMTTSTITRCNRRSPSSTQYNLTKRFRWQPVWKPEYSPQKTLTATDTDMSMPLPTAQLCSASNSTSTHPYSH
jgi:phytoene dehydrogenase-like protein